jgi:hypothetical protein
MQLLMAVPMTPSAAVSDVDGSRYRRFVPFKILLSLAAPKLHGILVLFTGNKFITGVVVTGNICSLVSFSPAINLSPGLILASTTLTINFLPVSLTPV